MPLLNDKSAVFAMGLIGAICYYGLKAAARRTVVVILPHDARACSGIFADFVQGAMRACLDRSCMLHYVCINDAIQQYDGLLAALRSPDVQGSPVICRVLDRRMLSVLENSGSKFVAIMSPRWVVSSTSHIASLRPWDADELPTDTALITSKDTWVPGSHVSQASTLIDDATSLLATRPMAKKLLVTDPGLLKSNPFATKLLHLYNSVKVLEGPTYADGYAAVAKALDG
jgi:hypothetical protein